MRYNPAVYCRECNRLDSCISFLQMCIFPLKTSNHCYLGLIRHFCPKIFIKFPLCSGLNDSIFNFFGLKFVSCALDCIALYWIIAHWWLESRNFKSDVNLHAGFILLKKNYLTFFLKSKMNFLIHKILKTTWSVLLILINFLSLSLSPPLFFFKLLNGIHNYSLKQATVFLSLSPS